MFKILIVDDNAAFRQSLIEILCADYTNTIIAESADAADAIDKVNKFEPDLVFMDINLPDGNGLSLTKDIKLDHSNITIFVITSHDIPEYHQAAFQLGASYFMSKDALSINEIRTVVEKVSSHLYLH